MAKTFYAPDHLLHMHVLFILSGLLPFKIFSLKNTTYTTKQQVNHIILYGEDVRNEKQMKDYRGTCPLTTQTLQLTTK